MKARSNSFFVWLFHAIFGFLPRLIVRFVFRKYRIKINGVYNFSPIISDPRFYYQVLFRGSLGLGDAWVKGYWDTKDPQSRTEFYTRLVNSGIEKSQIAKIGSAIFSLKMWLGGKQTRAQAKKVALQHYNDNHKFFEIMLGTMVYTSGLWEKARTLEEAQLDKCLALARLLDVQNSDNIIEIGCGYGHFAKYISQMGGHIVAVSNSKGHINYAIENFRSERINFQCSDFRDIEQQFNKAVSVEMIDATGPGEQNLQDHFQDVAERLYIDGRYVFQTIIMLDSGYATIDPFMEKHIFPRNKVHSIAQIMKACEKYFTVVEVHYIHPENYAQTLDAWINNISDPANLAILMRECPEYFTKKEKKYREYLEYLTRAKAGFLARKTALAHIKLKKR